ncbi:MAG TPA: Rne/Rng family ribonuclease [Acidimicrobiales bacterium]|nr:Rne/Rng family ribonuclease [Acidimicrobiales bacterium]
MSETSTGQTTPDPQPRPDRPGGADSSSSTPAEPLDAASTTAPGDAPASPGDGDGGAADAPARKKRRRGSRGGRNRRKPATDGRPADGEGDGDDAGPVESPAEEYARRPDDLPDRPGEGEPSGPATVTAEVPYRPRIGDTRPAPATASASAGGRRTRPTEGTGRRGRGGGRRSPAAVEASAGGDRTDVTDDLAAADRDDSTAAGDVGAAPASDGAETRKRRRRGGRGKGRKGDADVLESPLELDEETLERRRGKERKGRPVGRYLMCVNVRSHATQIAVLEGRSLIEHYVSRPQDDATQIDGNIYLARVQNVLPGMEAAFVDIGTPKNAVLYRGDVRYDADDLLENGGNGGGKGGRDLRIEQMLRPGQTIVCQVTKNPIGTKGARLTQEVSIPGRFVVLIPNSDTYGISKRLSDDERKRLRKILDEVKPEAHGLIVRTAAEGATAEELRRDVIRLVRQWDQIDSMAKRSKAPALLYREPDMAVRVIREEFNKDYRGVVIDDENLFREVRDYVESITPELADRVEYYDPADDTLPIFERFHVHEQLHKALDRKVWLPSGGSLIIERTEALTVIDVNTGKNVGTSSLEETVFRNNLEAAEEIARQLRLRDIGGIIVIDFIDMEVRSNREQVIAAFRDALARDKTRTQVFDISELGLVEMTRKRVSEGLVESFSETCPTCGGRGFLYDESLL